MKTETPETPTPAADVLQPIAPNPPAAEAPAEVKTETATSKPRGKSLLDDLSAATAPISDGAPHAEKTKEQPAASAEKPVDSPEAVKAPEQPKAEEKPAEAKPEPGTKEFNFRVLEQRTKELEEKLRLEAEEKQKAIAEREEKLATMQRELRAASIERDPEFIAKYDTGRDRRISAMTKLVEATHEQIKRAIAMGDDAALDEWRGQLTGKKAADWDAAMIKISELDTERAEAIADAENTWKHRQEMLLKREEQKRQEIAHVHIKTAHQVHADLCEKYPFVAKDEVSKAVSDMMVNAATKMNPAEILEQVGLAIARGEAINVQETIIQGLQGEKAQLEKQLAEAKEKLANQEQFINSRAGGTPRGESSGSTNNGNGKYVSLLDRMPEATAPLR